MYAKVFSQIFDSSIAENHEVRHVFEDLLKLADKDGVVDMTAEAIARRTNVPFEKVRFGLDELSKPDPRSRSHELDGRRIVLIDSHRDWGWQIVNYDHYRNLRSAEERRAYFRDAKRRQRGKSAKRKSKEQVRGEFDAREREYLKAEENGASQQVLDEIVARGLPETPS